MAIPPAEAEKGPDPPALTVAAVARRLGVAPATLRTWDRRYGLGPSSHTAGAHRRYTPADLARLAIMRRLTLEGVAPADAARAAVTTEAGAVPVPDPPQRSGGGGRVVALPDATPESRGLARAAMALDAFACGDIVSASLERRGVVPTWEDLLVPVLVGVGERWAATGQGVDVEHLLAESVMGALRAVGLALRQPRNARPVLLACAEEEQHTLPIHVLAAALAERDIAARVLGARLPREALVAAVRRSGPAAVFVWAHAPSSAAPAQLRDLPILRPSTTVVAGGPGWFREELPAEVALASSLPEALRLVVAATGQ